jgi:hypothetical protein
MSSYLGAAFEQQARRAWAAGKVIPHRITTALDAGELYGPEVDAACGVAEPAVDEWEAGTLYPTWEQLCALAALVDLSVHAFTMEPSAGAITGWICDRRRGGGCTLVQSDPVLEFTAEAIAAANLPRRPPPSNTPRPPTGRRRLRRVA